MSEYVVFFQISSEWSEQIQCFGHNPVSVIDTARRWLEESCGKVAARTAMATDVVAIQG